MELVALQIEAVAVFITQLVSSFGRDQHGELRTDRIARRIGGVDEIAVPDCRKVAEQPGEHGADRRLAVMDGIRGEFGEDRISVELKWSNTACRMTSAANRWREWETGFMAFEDPPGAPERKQVGVNLTARLPNVTLQTNFTGLKTFDRLVNRLSVKQAQLKLGCSGKRTTGSMEDWTIVQRISGGASASECGCGEKP